MVKLFAKNKGKIKTFCGIKKGENLKGIQGIMHSTGFQVRCHPGWFINICPCSQRLLCNDQSDERYHGMHKFGQFSFGTHCPMETTFVNLFVFLIPHSPLPLALGVGLKKGKPCTFPWQLITIYLACGICSMNNHLIDMTILSMWDLVPKHISIYSKWKK